jgi:hypothetical protein
LVPDRNFSVLDAVLLRPLPFPQQDRIVELRELNESGRGMPFAEPNFVDLKTRSRSFEALAQYSAWPAAVAGGSEPVRTSVASASKEFFRVLGVKPVLGRLFGEDEMQARQVLWSATDSGNVCWAGARISKAPRCASGIGASK